MANEYAHFDWAKFGGALLEQRVKHAPARVLAADVVRDGQLLPVVLCGPAGSGKTSLACAMVREIERHGMRVRMHAALSLALSCAQHPFGDGEPPIVRASLSERLLVVDELGAPPTLGRAWLEAILFGRYDRDLCTWVTTYLSHPEMSALYGDGFARRVFEGAVLIDCRTALAPSRDPARPHVEGCRCRACRPRRRVGLVAAPKPEEPLVSIPPECAKAIRGLGSMAAASGESPPTVEELEVRRQKAIRDAQAMAEAEAMESRDGAE